MFSVLFIFLEILEILLWGLKESRNFRSYFFKLESLKDIKKISGILGVDIEMEVRL